MIDEQFAPRSGDNDNGKVAHARKNGIYELFVLGELMDGPHHGYELREILSRMMGPFRHISWGVLYPLIRQLEGEGLIALDEGTGVEMPVPPSGGKQRKSYHITGSGRKQFYALMAESDEFSVDYPQLFMVKLNNFDHITVEQQLTILWHYRDYLRSIDLYLQGGRQYVLTNADVPDNQRAHILRTIGYRTSSVQAEITWIDSEIADVGSKQSKHSNVTEERYE
ncbi:MAG TPA: PadR family transcriptional regulator [Ktedonobacteraceae bacterium]|nr:PadR family transcriptional regulator [Ktedonobacteraceae bacterium]